MRMMTLSHWARLIAQGGCKKELDMLYPWTNNADAYMYLIEDASRVISGGDPVALMSAPGRTELGGNHTDHQHGRVLAAAICLDIKCAVAALEGTSVCVRSMGMPDVDIDISDITVHEAEKGTSAALIRGMASCIKQAGGNTGGFVAVMTSAIPAGSGLSSSAAYEVLIGSILNELYNGGRFTPQELAMFAKRAENEFFGKPCGLMDQMACAVGGAVAMDFNNPDAPLVERIDCDFNKLGYSLCITDTCASHADLTDEYAAITRDMREVAQELGVEYLRDADEGAFYSRLPVLRHALGDRPCLRAMHFFDENRRAGEEADALRAGDAARFITLMRESGASSELMLQNIWPCDKGEERSVALALAASSRILLKEGGAWRVHGGGFAGTIQALVPRALLARYIRSMDELMGKTGACREVTVRPVGTYAF